MVTANKRVEPDFSEIMSPVAAAGESEQVDISNTHSQAASHSQWHWTSWSLQPFGKWSSGPYPTFLLLIAHLLQVAFFSFENLYPRQWTFRSAQACQIVSLCRCVASWNTQITSLKSRAFAFPFPFSFAFAAHGAGKLRDVECFIDLLACFNPFTSRLQITRKPTGSVDTSLPFKIPAS